MNAIRRVLRAGVVCLSLLCGGAASGRSIDWVAQSFQGAAAPLQSTLDVAFSFRNNGARAATIRSIQTDCDCLAAQSDKSVYQPGEAGLVTARFTVGDRYGLYQRTVTVLTDDGPPQRLTVSIEVPEPAVAEPRDLLWPLGTPAAERSVDFRVAAGLRIEFSETFATNGAFRVRLESIEPGRLYRVHVTPVRTDSVANAAIRIAGRTAGGQEIVVSAYANVR